MSSASPENAQHHETSPPVCIVGAGLAGLATAAALHHIADIKDIEIVEQRSQEELSSETAGAAIQLGPNGLRALRAIGGDELVASVLQEGTSLKANAIFMPDQADPMILPDTTEATCDGLPQLLIRWSRLRDLLRGSLPDDGSIILKTGIDNVHGYSVDETDGSVTLARLPSVKTTDADGEEPKPYRFIVAADGIYSTFGSLIRLNERDNDSSERTETIKTTTLLPEGREEETRKSNIKDGGRINIKAVVPVNLHSEFEQFEPQSTYSVFAGTTACFAGPAGPGYTYWAISIADSIAADEGDFMEGISNKDKPAIKNKLLDRLRELKEDKCQFAIHLIEKTNAEALYVARSEERDIGSTLVSQDGAAVVLVGDAAHAMSPSYGVSASFAFEDAASLAMCVRCSNNSTASASINSAFSRYSKLRLDRCVEMQRRSAERTARATRGEPTEDISEWIHQWSIEESVSI